MMVVVLFVCLPPAAASMGSSHSLGVFPRGLDTMDGISSTMKAPLHAQCVMLPRYWTLWRGPMSAIGLPCLPRMSAICRLVTETSRDYVSRGVQLLAMAELIQRYWSFVRRQQRSSQIWVVKLRRLTLA